MKFTPLQEEEMSCLRKKAKSLIEKYSSRSMRNLQFELINYKEENFPSLTQFKVSFAWIGKIKKQCGKARSKNIVKEEAEKNLLQWLRKRKSNFLSSVITTGQVKTKWNSLFGKSPSRYALQCFRKKHGIEVVYSKQTNSTNCWNLA